MRPLGGQCHGALAVGLTTRCESSLAQLPGSGLLSESCILCVVRAGFCKECLAYIHSMEVIIQCMTLGDIVHSFDARESQGDWESQQLSEEGCAHFEE